MDTFDVIILTGRPAAGKSEVIDFLKKCPAEERARRFHIGEFEEFDDFPYVWETFEVDDILERHGRKRLWTDPEYYFTDPFVWNLYIERINLAFAKRLAERPDWLKDHTAIIEFARGGDNGIGEALSYLSQEILAKAGIVGLVLGANELIVGGLDGADQFIELEVHGQGIAILGVLDEEDHEEGDDGGAGVDDELPGL